MEIRKKSHGLKLEEFDNDFSDMSKIVSVTHVNPILKQKYHVFEQRLDHYIFGGFLCPVCNPELTSRYGKEILREMYSGEIEKEDQIINGIDVDFILKDKKTCLKYFGMEYFRNGKEYNKLAKEIISKFENDNKYDLLIMDFNDLN